MFCFIMSLEMQKNQIKISSCLVKLEKVFLPGYPFGNDTLICQFRNITCSILTSINH